MKNIILDKTRKVFIDEKEYKKFKIKINKNSDYFNKKK